VGFGRGHPFARDESDHGQLSVFLPIEFKNRNAPTAIKIATTTKLTITGCVKSYLTLIVFFVPCARPLPLEEKTQRLVDDRTPFQRR
jgi:hypothetical protein